MDGTYIDSVTTLLNMLKSKYSDGIITSFYEGDPIQIPDAAYPAIVVSKVTCSVDVDATGTDMMIEQLIIKVIMNKKDDLGAEDDQDLTERKLKLLVEGRNDVGQYADNTIMKLLRTMYTLGQSVVQNKMTINYDVIPLGGGRARSEADIALTLKERIIVLDRT